MSLLEHLRAAGLPMGTRYAPWTADEMDGQPSVTTQCYRSWTTDAGKANAARDLGAIVIEYLSADPTCDGWEVSCNEVIGG